MKIFDEVRNGLLEALKESAGELEEKGILIFLMWLAFMPKNLRTDPLNFRE